MNKSNATKPLPLFGIGPLYVAILLILTAVGTVLSQRGILPKIEIRALRWPMTAAGICLIAAGVYLWLTGAIFSKLNRRIQNNELVTEGIYAKVRHPIYSAFLFLCTGVLTLQNNVLLLALPVLFWGLLTILMKHTEEKWLSERFGKAYTEYCQTVPRCIPRIRAQRNK